MAQKPDISLAWDVRCQHCGGSTILQVDPQQVVAAYVLGYLNQELPALLGKHLKDASAGSGRGRFAKNEIDQLKKELAQSSQQREALRQQVADLTARLEEKIADQTSARVDIGRSMHTAHRQLADQVSGLFPRIHRVAREWAKARDAARSDRRSLSERAAIIFRLLFTPYLITDSDGDREQWASLTGANEEARSLAEDAAVLARQIAELPGYQRWIWDMVPAGTTFDPNVHLPWQSCAEEGGVEFVVIPAYLVDFSVITKPQVFTSWPDPA